MYHVDNGQAAGDDDDKITENYRPLQSLYGRKVYASYVYSSPTQGSSMITPSLLSIVILAVLSLFR